MDVPGSTACDGIHKKNLRVAPSLIKARAKKLAALRNGQIMREVGAADYRTLK